MENKIKIVYGDEIVGLHTGKWSVLFSLAQGGPVSLRIGGREWIYRIPAPAFWRATTDNDRGNGFPVRSAMWLGADLFSPCTGVKICVDGIAVPVPLAPHNNRYTEREYVSDVEITYTYETNTVPRAKVTVTYCMNRKDRITVAMQYEGAKGLPELPALGLRWITPFMAEEFCYEGLSGETYPDRMAGAQEGVYRIKGLPVTPYLVPQECGMHMNTKKLEILPPEKDAAAALRIESTRCPFAFSCLPYTASELENAAHQDELPPARRTVLCIYAAVRGVGGIDSWGADVGEQYSINAENSYNLEFALV